MSPSRPFILRPVATTLLMAAILLVGIVAYRFLPISALPEVDYPTIQVQTFYPGASPEVMTSSVTSPLEVQFGQMPGLNQMSSTSSAGASVTSMSTPAASGAAAATACSRTVWMVPAVDWQPPAVRSRRRRAMPASSSP